MTDYRLQTKPIRQTNGVEPLDDLISPSQNPTLHSFRLKPSPSVQSRPLACTGCSCIFLRLLVLPGRVVVAFLLRAAPGVIPRHIRYIRELPTPRHHGGSINVWTRDHLDSHQAGVTDHFPSRHPCLHLHQLNTGTWVGLTVSDTIRLGAVEAGRTRHRPCAPHSLPSPCLFKTHV
jgi:hypothetical protein